MTIGRSYFADGWWLRSGRVGLALIDALGWFRIECIRCDRFAGVDAEELNLMCEHVWRNENMIGVGGASRCVHNCNTFCLSLWALLFRSPSPSSSCRRRPLFWVYGASSRWITYHRWLGCKVKSVFDGYGSFEDAFSRSFLRAFNVIRCVSEFLLFSRSGHVVSLRVYEFPSFWGVFLHDPSFHQSEPRSFRLWLLCDSIRLFSPVSGICLRSSCFESFIVPPYSFDMNAFPFFKPSIDVIALVVGPLGYWVFFCVICTK